MKLLFQESTKKFVGLLIFAALLICFVYVIIRFNNSRKWIVKDSAVKVEEIGRFADGNDTCVIIKIFSNNNEYISTYTKIPQK